MYKGKKRTQYESKVGNKLVLHGDRSCRQSADKKWLTLLSDSVIIETRLWHRLWFYQLLIFNFRLWLPIISTSDYINHKWRTALLQLTGLSERWTIKYWLQNTTTKMRKTKRTSIFQASSIGNQFENVNIIASNYVVRSSNFLTYSVISNFNGNNDSINDQYSINDCISTIENSSILVKSDCGLELEACRGEKQV
jgi:UDP-2,3-diacylglucosamine pyrophosphatase LpxH